MTTPSNGISVRGFRVIASLLVLLVVAAACQNDGPKTEGGALVVAFPSEPNRLNPLLVSDAASFTVSEWVFRGLVQLSDNLEIVPDLAESWRMSPDGLTLTFFLREGLQWHDGRELTSRDVLFTYRMVVSPSTPAPQASAFASIQTVDAPDSRTVRVRYKRPHGSALTVWTMGIIPEHAFTGRAIDDPSFDKHPVGSGPYRLKEWRPGDRLLFEAFPAHHGGGPLTSRLAVRIIPDAATRLLELKRRAIDMAEFAASQILGPGGVIRQGLQGFHLFRAPSMRHSFLGLNLLDGRFRDKKVRQAFAHAINRKAVAEAVYGPYASLSSGPYPPGAWYASRSARLFHYDPSRSLQLLYAAGWKRGGDGLLRKDGKTFSFSLATNFESDENQRVAQLIQSDLRAIGIDTTVTLLEWQTFRHRVIASRQFEAVLISRAYLWDPDILELWHSSQSSEGGWNYLSYSNREADLLLERGRRALDRNARAAIYARLHNVLAEDQPCVFLFNMDGLYLANSRVRGVDPSPLGAYRTIAGIALSP